MNSKPRLPRLKELVIATFSALFLLALACGTDDAPASLFDSDKPPDTEWIIATDKVFTEEDITGLGWKPSRDFVLDYPGTTAAKWGFFQTREIGLLIYPTVAEAQEAGLKAAREQTATDEEGHVVGEIDRISCRSAAGQSAVHNIDTSPIKAGGLASYIPEPTDETLGQDSPFATQRPCPNKFPTYSEFRVIGNIVVLCEADGREVSGESKICENFPSDLGV